MNIKHIMPESIIRVCNLLSIVTTKQIAKYHAVSGPSTNTVDPGQSRCIMEPYDFTDQLITILQG